MPNIEDMIYAVVLVVAMLFGMRLLYGCWPWQTAIDYRISRRVYAIAKLYRQSHVEFMDGRHPAN